MQTQAMIVTPVAFQTVGIPFYESMRIYTENWKSGRSLDEYSRTLPHTILKKIQLPLA
jgi:hypothetical protein